MDGDAYYKKHYVVAVSLLPTYLMIAISLSQVSIIILLIGLALMGAVTGSVYEYIVLRDRRMERWGRYWLLFFGQIFIFSLLFIVIGAFFDAA